MAEMGYSEVRSTSIKKLTGENYATWSYQIRLVLMESDLWTIVEPGETKPDDANAEELRRFVTRQGKALAKICLSIGDEQQKHVQHLTCPKAVWEELERLYAPKDSKFRIVQLRRSLYSMKLGDHLNMDAYLGTINHTISELARVGDKIEDGDLAMVILCGLPGDWDHVVSTLCNVPENDFTSANVRRRLLAEWERKREAHVRVAGKEASAMITKASGSSNGPNPQGRTQRPKSTYKTDVHCFACGKKGHLVAECRNKWRNQGRNHRNARTDSRARSSDLLTILAKDQDPPDANQWVVDSGATHHMTSSEEYFKELQPCSIEKVKVADGSIVTVIGQGSVQADIREPKGSLDTFTASNVICVPGITHNVLSVAQMTSNGKQVIFDSTGCSIIDRDGIVLIRAAKRDNLFVVETSLQQNQVCGKAGMVRATSETKGRSSGSLETWHKRLMHINQETILKMAKGNIVHGLECEEVAPGVCEDCLQGKSTRRPFGRARASDEQGVPLSLVHMDIMGPMDTPSWGKKRYVLTITDDATRFLSVFFLQHKNETLEVFKNWLKEAETQTGHRLKRIRTDNGGEFCSTLWDEFCRSQGIVHETTMAHTPQQNGLAERQNRSLLDLVRSSMCSSGLPKAAWAELINTAAYLKNRVTNSHNTEKTPYELWYRRKPSVRHLRVIGCKAFMHIQRANRTSKLEPRAKEGVFVGYAKHGKGWRIWLPKEGKIYESRDCVFLENKVNASGEQLDLPYVNDTNSGEHGNQGPIQDEAVEWSCTDSDKTQIPTRDERSSIDSGASTSSGDRAKPRSTQRHPMELRKLPSRVMHEASVDLVVSSCGAKLPKKPESGLQDTIPLSYEEALSSPEAEEWISAMRKEMDCLEKYKVWDLSPLPESAKPLDCKWVYTKKIDGDGNVTAYKARLVAKGFNQQEGVDFDESYSPVPSFETVRMMTAIAVENNWHMDQYDVEAAYLHSDLDQVVYMKQPQGFVGLNQEKLYCRLRKSLYGLKQSSRCWNQCLDKRLRDSGFTCNASEPCVYVLDAEQGMAILTVYVDDIFVISESQAVQEKVRKILMKNFTCKYLGRVSNFLGVKFTHHNDGSVSLTQKAYIDQLVEKFNLTQAKGSHTPMETRPDLSVANAEEHNKQSYPYLELIGGLLYLSQRTRPDIAFSVGRLAQYNACYIEKHWQAAKRVLKYVKATSDLGLTYRRTGKRLIAYSDADWANCEATRKSTTGYVMFLADAPIIWKSIKQPIITLSSMEAEYVAISACVQELTWAKALLQSLGQDRFVDGPIELRTDSQAAINHALKSGTNSRTKHIDIRTHYVREKVAGEVVRLQYTPSEENVADIFTKPLCRNSHERHTQAMLCRIRLQSD